LVGWFVRWFVSYVRANNMLHLCYCFSIGVKTKQGIGQAFVMYLPEWLKNFIISKKKLVP